MKIEQHLLLIPTEGRGAKDITSEITSVLKPINIRTGMCNLFLQHTSASLIICENYDPQVKMDLEHFLVKLVPDGDPLFQHISEGDDDMPAHVRTILTQTSLSIPIQAGKLALGTWQGICLYEHRYQAHKRSLLITICGM